MLNEATTKRYIQHGNMYPYGSHAAISNIIGTGKVVLDVGCAAGELANSCAGNIFYGIEGNKEAASLAKVHYKDVYNLDLNNLTGDDLFSDKFDFIVFADVLEHLLYPQDVLTKLQKYLKPDGAVIVSLPNVALWRVRLNLLFGNFDYTDYGVLDRTHLHLYTFKSACKLLQNTGLKVVNLAGAGYTLGQYINLHPYIRNLLSVHIVVTAKK